MNNEKNRLMKPLGLATLGFIFLLSSSLPALAQDSGWSLGLGLAGATADADNGEEIDFGGVALFGRWQHDKSGWGAMAELRGFDDDESFIELEAGQLNLYGTYTWRRNKVARPFVKLGLASVTASLTDGPDSDDTGGVFGAGVEVGRGRWAFHFSFDATEVQLDVIDPDHKTNFSSSTLGVTLRF